MEKNFNLAEILANASAANIERNESINASIKEAKPRKARAKDLWYYVGRARVVFNRQFVKTNDLKWRILDNEFAHAYDREKLYLDYAQQINRLLDSRRFEDEAKEIGSAINIASHLVFLGKSAMNDVLEHGLNSVIGEKANLFKDSFIDNETLEIMGLINSEKSNAQTVNA